MPKPVRDKRYLAWIRSMPCCICKSTRNIETAHIGAHAMGRKASDHSVVPLCPNHHRTGRDSLHTLGRRTFEERHNIDLAALIVRLNTKPQMRIEGGHYVAYLDGQPVSVGHIRIGMQQAFRSARQINTELLVNREAS